MVNHVFPGVGADIQVAAVHADSVLRADLHAETAVDALAHVDRELEGLFLHVGVRVLPGHDIDTVCRAHGLAHHATHAARAAVLPLGQVVAGAKPPVPASVFLRVLDRHRAFPSGPDPEQVEHVEKHVHHEMAVGDPQAPEDFPDVNPLQESHGPFGIDLLYRDISQENPRNAFSAVSSLLTRS